MPYIGHNPTQAGSFVLLDDIASGFDGNDLTFTLQIGSVDITPTADNLIIALDGVIQHSPEAYSVSGSTLTFTAAPADGVDFYGMLMGQSASIGQGVIGADELSVTGDGSANQMLVRDGDGTMTWKGSGLSATSATGDIIYRNSSGELARLAVGSAGQVLTVASGVPAWETDVESYLPLSGGTMSGALNMGSQAITNAGTITGTFSGNITGNVTGNTSGTAASVTNASQGSITSLGTLTSITTSGDIKIDKTGQNNFKSYTDDTFALLVYDKSEDALKGTIFYEGTASGGLNRWSFGVNGNQNALYLNSDRSATFAGTISNQGLIYNQQTADEDGIRFRGYDDANIYYGKIGLGSGGYLQVFAEGNRSIDLKSGRQIRFFTSTDNSTYNNSVNFNSDGSSTFSGNITLSGSSTTRYLFLNSGGNGGVWQEGNYELRFGTNDTERMKIEGDGTVQFSNTATFQSNTTFAEYLKHDGDSDTFFRFSANNNIEITAGSHKLMRFEGNAQEVVINEDQTDIDFRVETADADKTLFVQGSTNDVLMGVAGGLENTHTGTKLEIIGSWGDPNHGNAMNSNAILRIAGGGHSNAIDMGVYSTSPYEGWIQGTNRGTSGGDAGVYGLKIQPKGGTLYLGSGSERIVADGVGATIMNTESVSIAGSTGWTTIKTLYGGYQSGMCVIHIYNATNAAATRTNIIAYNADYYDRTVDVINNNGGAGAAAGLDYRIVRQTDQSTSSDGGGPYVLQAKPSNGSSATVVKCLILSAGHHNP